MAALRTPARPFDRLADTHYNGQPFVASGNVPYGGPWIPPPPAMVRRSS
jgi:hypothetical protein